MKKLLFFASDFQIGIAALLTDQMIALQKGGVEFEAVGGSGEQQSGLIDRLRGNGVNLHIIPNLDEHSDFKGKAQQLAAIIDKGEIEIVHAQNNWQLALSAYCKYVLRKPIKIIYTIHGFRHNHPAKALVARGVIGSALLVAADRVICMSRYLSDQFSILRYKTTLLPLGVSDEFFLHQSDIEVKRDGIHAIFAAQFRYGKNQEILVEAFTKYINRTKDDKSTLTLPGSGERLETIKDLAKSLGIRDQVIFPGQCSKEEVVDLTRKCNVGLVSSNSETFGQCIVEPFVMGKCVVSRKVGIAPDIIKDGENGFIYNGVDDLTEIFMKMHANPELIERCGESALKESRQFAWGNVTERYKREILDTL